MQILAIAIQKGGTGKTATAAALANAAALKGRRVLAIDLDPQGNFSFELGAVPHGATAFDVIENGTPATEAIQPIRKNLDAIAASWSLSTLTTSKGSARRLQNALDLLAPNYDICIIDTPPTAGELQYNALQAATGLIIPLEADIHSLQSLYQIADTAAQIQQSNKALSIKGVLLTKYDNRSTIAKQMKAHTEAALNDMGIPFLGTVRAGIAVKEAAALQISLFENAPGSRPATDYMAIADKLF